jgi:hypothetical protein
MSVRQSMGAQPTMPQGTFFALHNGSLSLLTHVGHGNDGNDGNLTMVASVRVAHNGAIDRALSEVNLENLF